MSGRAAGRSHRGGGGHGEHEGGQERWLLTYADMITLLLALFIVLFALSSINQRKFLAFRMGLTSTFNPSAIATNGGSGLLQQTSIVDRLGTNPSPKPVLAGTSAPTPASSSSPPWKILDQLRSALKKAGLSRDAAVTLTSQGVVVQILADQLFFSTDSASFGPVGDEVVDTIARVVRPDPNAVQVEGFTDNQPVVGGPYRSNWELSAARAANVVNRMNVVDGISELRLTAVGYGQTHPQAPNTSPQNLAKNRRVDVVILSS